MAPQPRYRTPQRKLQKHEVEEERHAFPSANDFWVLGRMWNGRLVPNKSLALRSRHERSNGWRNHSSLHDHRSQFSENPTGTPTIGLREDPTTSPRYCDCTITVTGQAVRGSFHFLEQDNASDMNYEPGKRSL